MIPDQLTPEAILAHFDQANAFYARTVLGIEPELPEQEQPKPEDDAEGNLPALPTHGLS